MNNKMNNKTKIKIPNFNNDTENKIKKRTQKAM